MKQCHKTISFLLIFFSSVSASGRDTITPTQPLADNETLISVNGTFALGFFIPPNSNNRYIGLWYNLISEPTILWVANRANPLINSSGTLSITTDGRLLITDLKSTVVWWSTVNTASGLLTSAIARLLDNGNLVVVNQDRDADGESDVTDYAWQGFDHLTDTLLPGMQLGVDLTRGVNRTLVSWKSYNDPSPGEYYVYMDNQADAEMYLSTATTKLWRSGPWDGTHLSGIQYLGTDVGLISIFVNNLEQVTFAYNTSNRSVVSRLTVNTTGLLQHSIWLTEEREWNLYWFAPQQMCDVIGSCGPYGVCSPHNSPMCGCLQGFTPKNPKNWSLRNGTDGCVRKTSLDCTDGTDRFWMIVSNVKLPQSETVDMSLSLHECRDVCLSECSCTAYAVAMTNSSGSGRGCAIWVSDLYDIVQFVGSGQNLYMRMATDRVIGKDVPTDMVIGKHTITTTVVIIVIVVTGVLILTCAGFFLWRRQKRKIGLLTSTFFSDGSTYDHEGTRGDDMDLPIFTFDTIASATDNFSVNNKLGKGGFGPVYKGQLTKGQEIAVKRLAKTSAQGHEEFKNEVMLIAKLQHRNLVRLLGCCIQREERVLIYEYMPNGSLDAFLFEEKGALLDWNTRYLIIMGIARGLLYLHHDSRLRIIHRDLKASNILLDKHMNPKISDFGMARIFGGDELDFNTRKVVGTYGYMSPEYAMEGIFSVKSDVFSFGVLVLEIISGRKNRGEYTFSPHLNLVAHAWNLWNERRSLQLVHESMSDSFSATEALKCIKLGLLCVQERPEDRPLMSSVVVMLTSDITSLSPPKQPGFVAYTGPHGTNPSSNRQESCRSNELTVSLDGR